MSHPLLPLDLPIAMPTAPPPGIAHPDADGEQRGVLDLVEDHDRHHVVLMVDDREICRFSASQAQRLASMLFWCGQRVGDHKRKLKEAT